DVRAHARCTSRHTDCTRAPPWDVAAMATSSRPHRLTRPANGPLAAPSPRSPASGPAQPVSGALFPTRALHQRIFITRAAGGYMLAPRESVAAREAAIRPELLAAFIPAILAALYAARR